jgi:hypothetical protein
LARPRCCRGLATHQCTLPVAFNQSWLHWLHVSHPCLVGRRIAWAGEPSLLFCVVKCTACLPAAVFCLLGFLPCFSLSGCLGPLPNPAVCYVWLLFYFLSLLASYLHCCRGLCWRASTNCYVPPLSGRGASCCANFLGLWSTLTGRLSVPSVTAAHTCEPLGKYMPGWVLQMEGLPDAYTLTIYVARVWGTDASNQVSCFGSVLYCTSSQLLESVGLCMQQWCVNLSTRCSTLSVHLYGLMHNVVWRDVCRLCMRWFAVVCQQVSKATVCSAVIRRSAAAAGAFAVTSTLCLSMCAHRLVGLLIVGWICS